MLTDEQIEAMADDVEVRAVMSADSVVIDNPPDGLGDMLEMSAVHYCSGKRQPDCCGVTPGERMFHFMRRGRDGEMRYGSIVLRGED
jgi:hypothetical protein